MIIIHAFFKIDPDQREEFLEQARKVALPSQAEEGNISYQFYEDPDQANDFVFLEKWKDQAAIQTHEETSHFQTFKTELPRFLVEPLHVELFEATPKQ